MSAESHDALNTLVLCILSCMACSSEHLLLCVLRERNCIGMCIAVVLVQ